jgi:hypothetical protein
MATRILHSRLFTFLVFTLALGCLAAPIAGGREKPSQPFAQAELFVELNDTDGDLGLHAAIDGGTWTLLEVDDPRDRPLLGIVSTGRLRNQGLTQLAFESQEPSFDQLDPATFFKRFPEGLYEIEALAQGGGTFRNEVRLSHVLAAPAESTVNGHPAVPCDAPVLPVVSSPVLIDWEPVTQSHPEIGRSGPVTISRYQFFVDQGGTRLSIDLLPDVTQFEIPTSITAAGGVWKFEIIARTATNNNTAIEGCFQLQ